MSDSFLLKRSIRAQSRRLVLGLAALFAGPMAIAQSAVQVPVVSVQLKAVGNGFEMDGVVQAVKQSTVSAQASGRLDSRFSFTGVALMLLIDLALFGQQRPAQFILTGSQQFGLMSGITQSLAGRVALLNLLPFSAAELRGANLLPATPDEAIFKGCYPPIYDRQLEPGIWYANYVQTYVERDVRQLVNVRDLGQFQRFLRLCAGRTGQLLNLSALGDDAGLSHNTAREWLSVLEASYIIHRVQPHHQNFNKRLVKTPKLYFHDTGLAAWLLGIESAAQVTTHPLRGALFETWVVADYLKQRLNTARPSNLSFWRDRSGHEVDLLVEQGGQTQAIEIKSGATPGGPAPKWPTRLGT